MKAKAMRRWPEFLRGALTLLFLGQTPFGAASAPFVRDGEAGFVVSHIEFGLAQGALEAGACPQGMSRNLPEIYAMTPEGKRREDETEPAYLERLRAAASKLGVNSEGQNLCMHPEAGAPDPHFRTVEGSAIPVYGIDLDGEDSGNDFPGMDGQTGVDNQWYRVTGCSRSWQPDGQSNSFSIGMLTGSWGILIKLSGVEDVRNDDHVEVSLYANADPIRLSPSREPLDYATYSPDADPRFRASTTGKIENGVLTTVPVDALFRSETNSMYLERALRDARLKATVAEDGSLDGYLSGYSPVDAIYDTHYGFRSGVTADGDPSPLGLRTQSSNGAAFVLGHTCHGAYHALRRHADGHPDPQSGNYTSISTQYRISAVPAFVLDALPVMNKQDLTAREENPDEH